MTHRQALYLGLSLAFRPPTRGHVDGGADNALVETVATAAAALGCVVLQPALSALRDALATLAGGEASAAVTALEAEYNRLFVGPLPPLAHPYESVYRSLGGLVMGDCTLEVLQAYAEAGYALQADLKELPDHVAVELEYMALLWQRHEEAHSAGLTPLADGLRQQAQAFLTTHLCRWLPQFQQRLQRAGALSYYGQWARLAVDFTAWDAQRLGGEAR